MAAKKKPGAKKPAARPIPAEAQAVGVENLALAVDQVAVGLGQIGAAIRDVADCLCHPQIDGEGSRLERLVVAAERFAAAKEREADACAALASAHTRTSVVTEAESARRAERHVVELADLKARTEWRPTPAVSTPVEPPASSPTT